MIATEPSVAAMSAAVSTMASNWSMLDALAGGTATMRAAGKALLPRFPAEEDATYETRLKTAVLTNFFGRTVHVMASKPFSQEINTANLQGRVADLAEDIDGQGNELQSFAESLFRTCISHGLAGVLVDFPAGAPARNQAEERAAGLRPYWAPYLPGSILGWKAQQIGGEWRLLQLRLLESANEPNGRFGEKTVEQVRVLEPGIWEIWRRQETNREEWFLHAHGTTSLDVIPFQFFYGIRKGFGVGISPLIDLAFMNVEHWQSSSDQQNILHVARVPILFGKGFKPTENIAVGASSAVISEAPEADLKFVEHNGKAIEAGRQSLLDLEERMRQMGAELLVKRRASVTATQVVSEGDANKCVLQSIVEMFEDSINACLALTARWIGETEPGEIELFKDFGVDSLTDASAALLLDSAVAGIISRETYFEEMRRRSIIDADRQWSDESARIAAQPAPASEKLPIRPGRAD